MPFFSSSKSAFGPSGRSRKLFNLATGGSVTDVANYNGTGQLWRVHTFASSGNFVIVQAGQVFKAVVAGGGGAGGGEGHYYGRGGNGGAGTASENTLQLSVGTYAVTVGAGGSGGTPQHSNGAAGGSSSFAGITQSGGGGGGSGNNRFTGSPNGPQISSNIDGVTKTYGGSGGLGWTDPAYYAFGGQPGIVIIAYNIG